MDYYIKSHAVSTQTMETWMYSVLTPEATRASQPFKARQEENLKFLALPTVSKANNSYASKSVILSEFPNIRKENIKLLRLFCQSDSDQRVSPWASGSHYDRTAVIKERRHSNCLMDIFPEIKGPLFKRQSLCGAGPRELHTRCCLRCKHNTRCTQRQPLTSFVVGMKAGECTAW